MSLKKCLMSLVFMIAICVLAFACAETLTLPEDLQEIGPEAFANVHADYVAFPYGLTSIDETAFQDATFIGVGEPGIYAQSWCEAHGYEYQPYQTDPQWFTTTTLNNGTLSISKYTGTDENVYIPASIDGVAVTQIGTAAFMTNKNIHVVYIPEGVTTIGGSAFERCSGLERISLPEGLTKISGFAFSDCSSLTEIELPDSVATIEGGAFGKSTALTTVRLPAGLTSTPRGYSTNGPFNSSATITKVIFPEGMTSLPASVCDGMPALKEVVFPTTLTEIQSGAFRSCGLETVDIPAGVTTIGSSAFEYCRSLREVSLPEGLTEIGGFAFSDCSSLTEIELPDSVTTIVGGAFGKSTALTTVRLPAGLTSTPRGSSTNGPFNGSATITKVIFPEGMTSLPATVCWGMQALTTIVWPEAPETIGDGAFAYCDSLTEVNIPVSVITLGGFAFKDCQALASVSFPAGLTEVGGECFRGCESLERLDLPDSVEFIGGGAFRGCVSLEYFHYPLNFERTNSYGDTGLSTEKCNTILYGCSSLKSITVPEGVTKIPYRTFMNATALEQVRLPYSLREIETWAFRACPALRKVYVPSSVDTLGTGVFVDNSDLVVWCEYESTVLQYCMDNDTDYYYLSPDGLVVPRGSVYQGEGGVYGFARTGCSRQSLPLTSIVATLYNQDGSVRVQKTVEPGVNDYHLGGEINSAIDISGLPLGSYRLTLSASTDWSEEEWADVSFEVIEKVVCFTWRELGINPSYVMQNGSFHVQGEVISNFEITKLELRFTNETSGKVSLYESVLATPTNDIRFRSFSIDASDLDAGVNTVEVLATADGCREVVHTFFLVVNDGSIVDSAMRQAVVEYCADPDRYSFVQYSRMLQSYESSMNFGDMVQMALSDYTNRTRMYLYDCIRGEDKSTYQVELFEADIAGLIQEMYSSGTIPSFDAPDFLDELKDIASGAGAGVKMEKAKVKEIRDAVKDQTSYQFINATEAIESYDKMLAVFDVINGIDEGIEYTNVFLNSYCELMTDHTRDLAILEYIASANYGNREYLQALTNLKKRYLSSFDASMDVLTKKLRDEIIKYGTKKLESTIFEAAGPSANFVYKLTKISADKLLEVTGVTGAGKTKQEFYTRFSSQQALAEAYSDAVTAVNGANGNPSDEQIHTLQAVFLAYRTATARTFETIASLGGADAEHWSRHANDIRNRTMPGVN